LQSRIISRWAPPPSKARSTTASAGVELRLGISERDTTWNDGFPIDYNGNSHHAGRRIKPELAPGGLVISATLIGLAGRTLINFNALAIDPSNCPL
jgi:hypothetical protein